MPQAGPAPVRALSHAGAEEAKAIEVKKKALKEVCGVENTIATALDDFDFVIQALNKAAVEPLVKIIADFVEAIV